MKKDTIIITSGGMDSTVLLYTQQERIKRAVLFNYGQKHLKELRYAQYHCKKLKVPTTIINISQIFLHALKSNLLKTGGVIPNGHYADPVMKQTVVPFRNGIMLSFAIGIAESTNSEFVLIGAHSGDHTIYPDCRPDFIDALNRAAMLGTYKSIGIVAPFISLTKREIALLGKEQGVDFSKTWSCYKGLTKHCGVCGTCWERREALEGFDPTEYKGGN